MDGERAVSAASPRLTVLSAIEHQSLPITPDGLGSSVTQDEAQRLMLIGEQQRGFCEMGHRQIRLAQFCGVVNLGDRVLEVLPKVQDASVGADDCRAILLRLLRLSATLPPLPPASAGQHLRRAPLLDVFIAAFFRSVTTLIRGGMLRRYIERSEDLPLVRGRIAQARQFGIHANRLDRVACTFDELSADNVWNRLLKRAIRVTRPWLHRTDLQRQWIELMGVLADVDDTRLQATQVNRLNFDRQAERYREAVDWARRILALLTPSARAGQHEAPALLFDMNRLFESAVSQVLGHAAAARGLHVHAQDRACALATLHMADQAEPAFHLRPDLVIRRAGHVAVVADTKWKRVALDRHGRPVPTQADMYQMHAYASAYGCRDLALVYPVQAETRISEAHYQLRVGAMTATLHVVGIDVGDDRLAMRVGRGPAELIELLGI